MNYIVLDTLTVKTQQGQKTIVPGSIIILPESKATVLIQSGKIKPEITEEQMEACEERAAIMQHDGGLSKEDADKYAWCYSVCMLTPGQRRLCERVNPCPKENA